MRGYRALHRLREYVVDELQQHGAIDPPHLGTSSLLRREDLWQQHAVANAAGDHIIALGVGRSLGRQHVWLLARQHDGVRWSGVEAECSLIEEDHTTLVDALQLASQVNDLVTQASRHYRTESVHSSTHSDVSRVSHALLHSLSAAVLFLLGLSRPLSSSLP